METTISRRNLIKGSAAFAAAATLLGASACSPQKEAENAPAAQADLPPDLRMSDFEYSVVETDPVTSFASEETYDIVVVGAGCAGVPAVLTAVEEGATVACLQKEATVSANGNGCSFVVKEASNLSGIARWRSDWAKLNDWRINPALFQYYVDYAEEAVPCSVAGAVIVAEEEKAADDDDIEYRQVYPLIGDKVRVYDRENDECADAEEHCKALHDDILTCMLAGRNTLNRINAEHGAYETHNEQEHVRPL